MLNSLLPQGVPLGFVLVFALLHTSNSLLPSALDANLCLEKSEC